MIPESFSGGRNGEDGHGFTGQHTAPGQGTYQDISNYYLQYFKISPGIGGIPARAIKDGGLNGGGGGGVIINGEGPKRSSINQGLGYGGGGGGCDELEAWNGLPGVVIVEVVDALA